MADSECAKFKKTKVGHFEFFIAPGKEATHKRVEEFLVGYVADFPAFGVADAERAVYLLKNEDAVFKYRKFGRWSVRFRNGLRVKRSGKNCLADEFSNLAKLTSSDLTPAVYGYAHRRTFGFLFEELLVVEYFSGSCTLDALLQRDRSIAGDILLRVFELFSRMLDQGFVHLDSHPNNIIVTAAGDLKFIDFEGCSFDVTDRLFCLAFCVGRFYRFWFEKYMSEDVYDAAVSGLVTKHDALAAERFFALYAIFKSEKVSRKLCYQYFYKRKVREDFISSCLKMYRAR